MQPSRLQKRSKFYESDLEIAKELGDKNGEGCVYGNVGIEYHRLGDFKKAKKFLEIALQISKEVGNKDAMAISLDLLAWSKL